MNRKKFNKNYYFGEVYEDYDAFLDFGKLAEGLIERYKFMSFLDIGCGCGNLVKEIKRQLEQKCGRPCDIQGIDFSRFAVKRAAVPFVRLADCTRLPFENARFDLVYVLGTFSYLKTRIKIIEAMREAYRVAKSQIVFEDVYTLPDRLSDDYDPYRERILEQKQWVELWGEITTNDHVIGLDGDEVIIRKNES